MKLYIQIISLVALLGSAVNAAAINALTLIHPETQQTLVMFGDMHNSYDFMSTEEQDEYVDDMVLAMEDLHQQGYELFFEPTAFESSLYNEIVVPFLEKHFPTKQQQTILFRVGKKLASKRIALFAHDVERAALCDTLLLLRHCIINNIMQKIECAWPAITDYLKITANRCYENFQELSHLQQFSQFNACLESFISLIAATEDLSGNQLKSWLVNSASKSNIENIILHAADLTTLNHILNTDKNIAIYAGFCHVYNLQRLLQSCGFVTAKEICNIKKIEIFDTISSSELSHNKTFIKNYIFACLDYRNLTVQQLLRINLLAHLIADREKLDRVKQFISGKYDMENWNKIFYVWETCKKLRSRLSQNYLTIDPSIFLKNPSRVQSAAEEIMLTQRLVPLHLCQDIRIALNNIELVYQTIPGISGNTCSVERT